MFRCVKCKIVFEDIEDVCPECGGPLEKMCCKDTGSCNHGVVDGTAICEECGSFVCPVCGAHDCVAISRITGYMSPIGNGSWNSAKVQELHDRTRYDV